MQENKQMLNECTIHICAHVFIEEKKKLAQTCIILQFYKTCFFYQ